MPAPRPNSVDYVEIPSRAVARSKAFFTALVGWRFTDYGPDYVAFEDGRLNGGFFTADTVARAATGSAMIILYSEQLEQIRERALGLGATITRDTFSFPGGRRFHFAEPGGSEFAVWSDREADGAPVRPTG